MFYSKLKEQVNEEKFETNLYLIRKRIEIVCLGFLIGFFLYMIFPQIFFSEEMIKLLTTKLVNKFK